MTVYVDKSKYRYRGMIMCHMIADTYEELNMMALKIGLKSSYIQKAGTPYEHFDICKTKRAKAIELGAIEVTTRDIIKKIQDKKLAR